MDGRMVRWCLVCVVYSVNKCVNFDFAVFLIGAAAAAAALRSRFALSLSVSSEHSSRMEAALPLLQQQRFNSK